MSRSRKKPRQAETLTVSFTRAALQRVEAAEFVGISAGTFDKLVAGGHLPKARRYPGTRRLFWLTYELDHALRDMPYADGTPADPWAGVGDDPWEGVEI